MSQTEQQEAPVDNNEQDDDNFSIVDGDGVEELCLDASGEIEKLQGNEQQYQKLDEITWKMAALEQKHQEEIAELKMKNVLLTEENGAFGLKMNEAEGKAEKKMAEFEKKLALLEEAHHKGIAELKTKNQQQQQQQEKAIPETGAIAAVSSKFNNGTAAVAIHNSNDGCNNFQELVAKIRSADPAVQLASVTQARQLLSSNVLTSTSTIDALIIGGILPHLVKCLEQTNATLQFEAAWALINIASGTPDQTRAVVQAGAVPRFIKLLESPNMNVCEQAMWALGNIIGDGPHFRDLCIDMGIMPPLLKFVASDAIPLTLLRHVSWVILNFCRHKFPPSARQYVELLLSALDTLIQHKDTTILVDSVWALYFLIVGGNKDNDPVQQQATLMVAVFANQVAPLLGHTDARVQKAALHTLGKFVASGTHDQIQLVFEYVAVQIRPIFLSHLEEHILNEEALQFISKMLEM